MASTKSELDGSRILVVGAVGGIGSAIVRRLVYSRAHVAGWDADHSVSAAGDYHEITVDCSDEAEVATATIDTIDRLGSLDAVVIASGTIGRGWLHDTALAEWQRVVDNNLTATFLILRSTLPHMFDRGGAVVTIGSTASTVVTGGGTAASYGASKAAVLQLTRQVGVDYAGYGIRANCVCPGWIETPFNERSRLAAGEAWTDERLPRTDLAAPISGPGQPDDVASTVEFLLSPGASFINASAVMVDGATPRCSSHTWPRGDSIR